MKKVRAGQVFVFVPVLLDVMNWPADVRVGDVVKVVKLPGCPAPGTMGHCHIAHVPSGRFAGLVCTNSLVSQKDAPAMLIAWHAAYDTK